MKEIILPQPWASLMAIGAKKVITRPDPTSYRGPVTIIAATQELSIDDPYLANVLKAAGYQITDLPLGAALASGNLVACTKIVASNIPCYPEYAFSDFKEGWYAWKLADVTRLFP